MVPYLGVSDGLVEEELRESLHGGGAKLVAYNG